METGENTTLNEAAKLSGRAKSTISKALKSGKLSYVSKNPDTGAYEIQVSELMRVFPPKPETGNGDQKETPKKTHHGNSALAVEVKMLREQVDTLGTERDRERDQLTEQIEDLRKRLDVSESRVTALLSDQRPEKGRGFTLWPFGRKASA